MYANPVIWVYRCWDKVLNLGTFTYILLLSKASSKVMLTGTYRGYTHRTGIEELTWLPFQIGMNRKTSYTLQVIIDIHVKKYYRIKALQIIALLVLSAIDYCPATQLTEKLAPGSHLFCNTF